MPFTEEDYASIAHPNPSPTNVVAVRRERLSTIALMRIADALERITHEESMIKFLDNLIDHLEGKK